MIGKTLGHYRVGEQLGRGGMGEVYLADDLNLNRKVALKFLLGAFTGDPERMARFEREAKLLASLNHPNIASIYGLEQAEGKRFLVLELVEGETLAQRLSKGPLSVEEALGICRQIAEGLEAAHEKGVIHRDLKPANVMITEGDKVKILDFGLAKALSDETQSVDSSQSSTLTEAMTRPGVILGTAAYMSPEQAKGKAVDKRADIWAFGCILYECLTGKRPFEGETVTETLASILKGNPDWKDLPTGIPCNLIVLLDRCLRKDPRERLHDIADGRIEINEPAAQPAEAANVRRHISLLWFACAVAILLAALAAWGWLRRHAGSETRQVFHLPLSVRTPSRYPNFWGAALALSRDGTKLAYRTSRGWQLLDLATGTSRVITTELQGNHAVFSPRGDTLLIRQGGWVGRLATISLSTSTARVLLSPVTGGEMQWEDDGWIYFGRLYGIARVREEGGTVEDLFVPDPAHDNWVSCNPMPLPGGHGIIFTRRQRPLWDHSRDEICVLGPGRKAPRVLAKGQQAWYVAGGYLVMVHSDGAVFAAPFDLSTQELAGEAVKVLDGVATLGTTYGAASLKVADNGTLLYVTRTAPEEDDLVMVDRAGTPQRTITGWGGWIQDGGLSSDGKRIVVSLYREFGTPNVWLRDLSPSQTQLVRISYGEFLDFSPQFMADDRSVAYVSPREGKNWDLYNTTAGSGAEERILLDRPGDIMTPLFTAGGWVVFCESDSKGQNDVIASKLGTDVVVKVAATAADESMPTASPDARWVAYQSDVLGHNEVYVRPLQMAGSVQQISTGGGSAPCWSRGGKELFYINTQRQLVSVRADITGSPAGQDQRILFSLGDLTWARMVLPDDQGFVMIRHKASDAPGELVLVQNWFEELKRIVPIGK